VRTIPDLKYTKDHTWVKIDSGEIATIGITDFAQENMGEMTYVEFPEIGLQVSYGDFLCVIASSKAIVDLLSPLSGEVKEINEEVVKTPKLINESPYDEGWLIKLKASNLAELKDLMSSKSYGEFIENI
jgi:glycine cleavage system H protein